MRCVNRLPPWLPSVRDVQFDTSRHVHAALLQPPSQQCHENVNSRTMDVRFPLFHSELSIPIPIHMWINRYTVDNIMDCVWIWVVLISRLEIMNVIDPGRSTERGRSILKFVFSSQFLVYRPTSWTQVVTRCTQRKRLSIWLQGLGPPVVIGGTKRVVLVPLPQVTILQSNWQPFAFRVPKGSPTRLAWTPCLRQSDGCWY